MTGRNQGRYAAFRADGLLKAMLSVWLLFALLLQAAEGSLSESNAVTWRLKGAGASGRQADISGHTRNARSIDFKPDGSRMYVVGRDTRNVAEYTLISAWDISTASFLRDLKIYAGAAHGLFFNKGNGTDMYIFNRSRIHQYHLSKPWDVTTAVLVKSKVMRCEAVTIGRGHDIHFKPDGTRLYVEDRLRQEAFEYALSTPWDVGTLAWKHTLDISDQQKAVRGIELDPTGTRMWLMDTEQSLVLEYQLKEPWDLATAVFQESLSLADVADNMRGITWRPDGRAFFITATSSGTIHEFVLE